MRIESVRIGFANNSSSSHSIIVGCKNVRDNHDGQEYGWENFTLSSPLAKRAYMATNIYCALKGQFGSRIAELVAKDITNFEFPQRSDEDECGTYVDHQSVIQAPVMFKSPFYPPEPNFDFLKELTESVVNNAKYTIVGGNDNDSRHPLLTKDNWWYPYGSIPKDHPNIGELVARKDGKYWTLFNRKTGTKIRICFDDNAPPQTYSETPELVDVCITKKCNMHCEFCYQNASKEGKHADLDTINDILWRLRLDEVFEVAIGGGEPTQHPDFAKILQAAYDNGVVPNFTTANTDWMHDDKIVEAVNKYCGSFAISISNWQAVEEAYQWNRTKRGTYGAVRASVQIPLGCMPWKEINECLKKANVLYTPITFLGYKACGKAADRKPDPYHKQMLEWLDKNGEEPFGADTAFVQEFADKLKKMEVDPKLVSDGEGMYSCYIDAVEKKIGAHSYGAKMKSYDNRDLFQDFPYKECKNK